MVATEKIGPASTIEEAPSSAAKVSIIAIVAFDSPAQDAGLDWDQQILSVQVPNEQPIKYLVFIPALAILGLVILTPTASSATPPSPSWW